MRDAPMLLPANRFDGLAEAYDVYRPHYPLALFEDLAAQMPQTPRCAIDVGAGTGISTAHLVDVLPPDVLILALEPGSDMRRVLGRRFRSTTSVQIFDARAEEMPMPPGSAGLITACQAFHWFHHPSFYAEVTRVLAPGGLLALIRNRRVPTPLLERFDAFIRAETTDDLVRLARDREPSVEALNAVDGLGEAASITLRWARPMEEMELINMYLTRSVTVPVIHRLGLGRVLEELRGIYRDEAAGQPVTIAYETTMQTARRLA